MQAPALFNHSIQIFMILIFLQLTQYIRFHVLTD